ncbi:MAG TPA: hypothetical protein VG125_22360 [Pirellulales bacterium]|nr:hypothetical protein [Pirellulales bacterium]
MAAGPNYLTGKIAFLETEVKSAGEQNNLAAQRRGTLLGSDETKFVGPRGGVSDDGIKDDRLKVGAEITLVIAGNNKTVREVRLPMREKEERNRQNQVG